METIRDVIDKVEHDGHKKEIEEIMDCKLVAETQELMRITLKRAREKGFHGWWSEDVCSIDDLRAQLRDKVEKDDMTAVINLAAMISARHRDDIREVKRMIDDIVRGK